MAIFKVLEANEVKVLREASVYGLVINKILVDRNRPQYDNTGKSLCKISNANGGKFEIVNADFLYA